MRIVERALSHVNTSHLRTEDDYKHAAEDYLAGVLVRIGEEVAAAVWDRCSEGLEEAPFTRPEKRADYINRAGVVFEKKASSKSRQFYLDLIAECLRRIDAGNPHFASPSHRRVTNRKQASNSTDAS